MIYLGANELTLYGLFVFILSILGSLFIILSYYKFPELRDHLLKCVLFISISDLIYTTVFFICYFLPLGTTPSSSSSSAPAHPTNAICYFEAIFLEEFIIASWFWPACFALQLYLHIVLGKNVTDFRYFHAVSWGVPLICNIILVSYGAFAPPSGPHGWCWIDPTETVLIFVCGYGILAVLLIFETVLYVAIVNHIRRQVTAFSLFSGVTISNQLESRANRLTFYLLVPLVCWSWGLASRIYEVSVNVDGIGWLTEVQGTFAASQGLWNALIYLFNSKLRVMWWETLQGRRATPPPLSTSSYSPIPAYPSQEFQPILTGARYSTGSDTSSDEFSRSVNSSR